MSRTSSRLGKLLLIRGLTAVQRTLEEVDDVSLFNARNPTTDLRASYSEGKTKVSGPGEGMEGVEG